MALDSEVKTVCQYKARLPTPHSNVFVLRDHSPLLYMGGELGEALKRFEVDSALTVDLFDNKKQSSLELERTCLVSSRK